MSKLVIAEKPMLARDIARAITGKEVSESARLPISGNGYTVCACAGHLLELVEPDTIDPKWGMPWSLDVLPIEVHDWPKEPAVDKKTGESKKPLIDQIAGLLKTCDSVIAAGDPDDEGQLIVDELLDYLGYAGKVERVYVNDNIEKNIVKAFDKLVPNDSCRGAGNAAYARQMADMCFGVNETRLATKRLDGLFTVGRVQTPTLKMLVDRDAKILRFQKERYYTVGIQSGSLKADSGRISDAETANSLKEKCTGANAVCTSIRREKKAEQPPKLYDLTTMQREANRLFGFTAKQTLDYAQQLYEKKLLTYPRTDSQYLAEDMGQTVQHLVSDLLGLLPFAQGLALTAEVGRVLNSKKVSDHHAIIPTSEFVKQGFTGLAESECKLMNLVCSKLLCAIAAPHEYETVTAVFFCAGNEFTAKGKTVLVPGWKEIDQRFRSTMKADGKEEAESLNTLPEMAEGQSFRVTSTVSEHFTSPPKAYTEDTLLSAMERAGAEDMPEEAERKGLGTPATRAAILEKLVQMGFVQRKGKQLVPTKDGINLAVVLPESLTSPALTAEWENRLTEIAKGNADPDEFMAEIEAQVRQLVKTYSCISADKQNLFQSERVIIGKCPRCSENVYEGKKNFYCGNRSCQFVMWKNDRFFEQRKKAFTPKIAAALLKNGKAKVKGLYSEKTGKTYDATVLLADTGGKYVNYRIATDSIM